MSTALSLRLRHKACLLIMVLLIIFALSEARAGIIRFLGLDKHFTSKKNQITQSFPLTIAGTPLYQVGVQSRSITAENQTGAPGVGGQSGERRKGLPCLWNLQKDMVYSFAEIDGPGVIRHIWITVQDVGSQKMRNLILRFYWDGQEQPSVEAPLSDFFGVSHGRIRPFESMFLTTAEGRSFNCYFPMPFTKKARLTIANEMGEDAGMFFYQVDYTLGDKIPEDTPRFHAQFRRVPNTTLARDYVILDGVHGQGRFMGANIGIVDRFANLQSWWGEGEVKIYLDGDDSHPTICGTGSEDYALSGWGLKCFSNLESGAPLIEGKFISYYRFHGRDPIYFSKDIKVTIQQLGYDGQVEPADPKGPYKEMIEKGWYRKDRRSGCYERVDDMCSTAYWYQTLPTQPFPPFPDRKLRELDLK
jgi:hypothetical protein